MSPSIKPHARIDLHTHSNRSDGTDSPDQVIRDAAGAGLDIVAITDHDTTSSWDAAFETAEQVGIGLIPGIEVTTRTHVTGRDGSIVKFSTHLLAYLPDPANAELALALRASVDSRVNRLRAITEALASDYDLDWGQVVVELANGKTAGRPAIADAMIRLGILGAREEFFELVYPGSKYYVPNRGVPDTIEAIGLIRRAGGVPVIAHPMARGRGPAKGEPMPEEHFAQMIQAGLAGFEAYHRDVAPHVTAWLEGLAKRHGLVVTGSSDYHGHGKPNRLGENLTPVWALEQILAQGNQLARL